MYNALQYIATIWGREKGWRHSFILRKGISFSVFSWFLNFVVVWQENPQSRLKLASLWGRTEVPGVATACCLTGDKQRAKKHGSHVPPRHFLEAKWCNTSWKFWVSGSRAPSRWLGNAIFSSLVSQFVVERAWAHPPSYPARRGEGRKEQHCGCHAPSADGVLQLNWFTYPEGEGKEGKWLSTSSSYLSCSSSSTGWMHPAQLSSRLLLEVSYSAMGLGKSQILLDSDGPSWFHMIYICNSDDDHQMIAYVQGHSLQPPNHRSSATPCHTSTKSWIHDTDHLDFHDF